MFLQMSVVFLFRASLIPQRQSKEIRLIPNSKYVPIADKSHYVTTISYDSPEKLNYTHFKRGASKDAIKMGVDLLHALSVLFSSEGIEWCLFFGTLAGQQHFHNIIPWDDDWDIVVFAPRIEVLEIMETFISEHPEYGYKDYAYRIGKFYRGDGLQVGEYSWKWPFVDVFYATKRYDLVFTNFMWQFKEEDVFPLGEGYFGGLLFPIPHNPKKLLKFIYKSKFGSVCKTGYNHLNDHIQRIFSIECSKIGKYSWVVAGKESSCLSVERMVRDGKEFYRIEKRGDIFMYVRD